MVPILDSHRGMSEHASQAAKHLATHSQFNETPTHPIDTTCMRRISINKTESHAALVALPSVCWRQARAYIAAAYAHCNIAGDVAAKRADRSTRCMLVCYCTAYSM